MITLFDATRPVKTSRTDRPFAAGLVEPEAAPAAVPGEPVPPWEREVRAFLASFGYIRAEKNAAIAWIGSRGNIDGCPVIQGVDWNPVNHIVERHRIATVAPAPSRRPSSPTSQDRAGGHGSRRRSNPVGSNGGPRRVQRRTP